MSNKNTSNKGEGGEYDNKIMKSQKSKLFTTWLWKTRGKPLINNSSRGTYLASLAL